MNHISRAALQFSHLYSAALHLDPVTSKETKKCPYLSKQNKSLVKFDCFSLIAVIHNQAGATVSKGTDFPEGRYHCRREDGSVVRSRTTDPSVASSL